VSAVLGAGESEITGRDRLTFVMLSAWGRMALLHDLQKVNTVCSSSFSLPSSQSTLSSSSIVTRLEMGYYEIRFGLVRGDRRGGGKA
jgi:hypothetical protein